MVGQSRWLTTQGLRDKSFRLHWAKTSHGERRLSDSVAGVGVGKMLSTPITPSDNTILEISILGTQHLPSCVISSHKMILVKRP